MDSLDYWRICDELNIIQAALLLVECNPSDEFYYVENWQQDKKHSDPILRVSKYIIGRDVGLECA